MKTIRGYKTREGHYGFTDPASEHDYIIFDDGMHAIDELGVIWQVVDKLDEEHGEGWLTFEDEEHLYIFNYAEDGKAAEWMASHYLITDVDWETVAEHIDSEGIFNLMKESATEEVFIKTLIDNKA